MSYDINYTDMDPDTRHVRAINDIKEYLGEEKFREFTAVFRCAENLSEIEFIVGCFIVGIQGTPVNEWYDYCFNKRMSDELAFYQGE